MVQNISEFKPRPRIQINDFITYLRRLPEIYQDADMFRYKAADGVVTGLKAQEFVDLCASFGAALVDLDLTKAKVAVIGETSVKWLATYFGQTAGGGVIVPIDKDLSNGEIADLLRESGVSAVVYSPSMEETILAIQKDVPNVHTYIPMEGAGDSSWDALAQKGRPKATQFLEQEGNPDAMSTILYTAGTTGRSKGVMLTQRGILTVSTSALQLIRVGDCCMSTLPIHHTYEFSHGIIMMSVNGATICLSESPRYFLQNLQIYKPNTLLLVPMYLEMMYKKLWAQWRQDGKEEELRSLLEESKRLLEQGIDKREELFAPVREQFGGNLRTLLCGGAPLSPFYDQGFRDLGFEVVQGYGITECAPLVAVTPNECAKIGSVGPAIPCCEIRLNDMDETGQGELCVKGDNVMLGYYNAPEATQQVLHDGWFDTGDLARIDEDGYVYITGRRKNVIVLASGKNVQPEEIEGYLSAIPLITEAVVYSPVDASGAQRVLHAQIYVADTARGDRTDDELRVLLEEEIAQVNKQLPGYKQIAEFILRDKPFDKTTKMSIQRYKIDTSL